MAWLLAIVAIILAGMCLVLTLRLRAATRTTNDLRAALRQHAEQEGALRTAAAEQADKLATLEQLAARNAAILKNAMDGFFVLNHDYRFLEVNDAFCQMTGYDADELLQMTMTDLEVSTPGYDSAEVAFWRTGLHHFATAHRHKDGHLIQLESCVIVLREGDDKILVGFARDVTERIRAEMALRKSESQYRNLVETSRDLIWSIDNEGRWTFVNNAARDIYGYEPEEMLGRSIMEFVHPRLRPRGQRILAELRAGKPRQRFETEHLRKDGSSVYLSINVIPVRDEHDRVVGCAGTSTDLTDRKAAEERLRAANERFESLVKRMPLGYVVWTNDQRVLEWNPAAASMFGFQPDEVVGRQLTDLIVGGEGQKAFASMARSVLSGEPGTGSMLVNRKKDGEKIKCEWYNTPLPTMDGVQAIASLVRDISERERLEAQLRQSQRLESLGVLAGGVAHDFNNLLVGIMGNASLAMERVPDDADVRKLLDKVVSAGRRATELTQRMLAYAGRASTDVQVMDLNDLVAEMAEFAAAAIPKNVSLHMDTADDLPLIRADSSQVQQIIMNLLINAAEAMGEGGDVTVTTRTEQLDAHRISSSLAEFKLQPGTYVCLEVRDTGSGMPPEILSRIFDPFFSTKFAGRGLGLSAILGIVRAHHGAVAVQSQEGVGTTFRVWFPVTQRRAMRPRGEKTRTTLPRGSTVLVIDDEEDIRDVVEAVLNSRGIRVLTAEDGERGLTIFQEHVDEIDAVLLDINMPGMSGDVVFEKLLDMRPDIKVLLSTGYSEQEAASHFQDAPLAGFVHKPYTASSLVEKIGSALAGA